MDTVFQVTTENRGDKVVPFFIPFAGCPHRCIFCAQERQTGRSGHTDNLTLLDALANLLRELDERHKEGVAYELAFYGGTFTALPESFQFACLNMVAPYREQGLIRSIRCSTRPDCVTGDRLVRLKAAGLETVELGIQSFSTEALQTSQRGYPGRAALAGCRRVQEAGLRLGIQLLPGMPGGRPEVFQEDLKQCFKIRPDFMRWYPCLVVEGTPLAEAWRQGLYTPWTLDETVRILGEALFYAWQEQIPVIRLSLAPEDSLEQAILAGPRHPALGSMIQAEALLRGVSQACKQEVRAIQRLEIPKRCQGFFWGHKKALQKDWEALGVTSPKLVWTETEQGRVVWSVSEEKVIS